MSPSTFRREGGMMSSNVRMEVSIRGYGRSATGHCVLVHASVASCQHRPYAADSSRGGLLLQYFKFLVARPELGSVRDVRATAEFNREGALERAHRIDRDHLGVVGTKLVLGAELLGLGFRHIGANDGNSLRNFCVHHLLHLGNLLRRHLLSVGEVNPEPFARDVRAALVHLASQDHLERLQQEVVRRMILNRLFGVVGQSARKLLCGPCARGGLMLLHQLLHRLTVYCNASLFCDFFCELYGESICRIEHKYRLRLNVGLTMSNMFFKFT